MKIKNFKSKCACYGGGIGICLCIVFMSIGIVGITSVGLLKSSNNMGEGNMGSMSGMGTPLVSATGHSTFQYIIVSFFSGFWGTVILLVSFVVIIAGMWF